MKSSIKGEAERGRPLRGGERENGERGGTDAGRK